MNKFVLKGIKDSVVILLKMQLTQEQIEQMNAVLEHHTTLNKIQLYRDAGASPYIIGILMKQLELSNPKKFGIMMECVAQSIFGLDNSTNSEHDKIKNGKKLEIKTSTMSINGLQRGKRVFQYNSIRMKYDYDYLMICNINFTTIDYYLISKEKLGQLSEMFQGQKRFRNDSIIEILQFDKIKNYCVAINPSNIGEILN